MKIFAFDDAIKSTDKYSTRHVLLGNGFSIACRKNIFRYDALFKQADFAALSKSAKASFAALGTTDFERVIKSLRDAANLADTYGSPIKISSVMRKDAVALKELLVQTIAKSHPERPSDIADDEYTTCQSFLAHFTTTYTLNYDLLLYWAHMHREDEADIRSDDGFRTSQDDIDDDNESDYVVWEPGQSHDQNTWFLHGALHVFDSGTQVKKFTWKRTGVRLIEQIRRAMSKDYFPLFVAEGTSDEKLERIRHSDYLAKAYRSFEEIKNCLFIYGHSLAPNDEHYLRLIERGKLSHLFVGLFGDPSSVENRKIISRAQAMKTWKSRRTSLKVEFYDSSTAKVWR